MNNSWTRHKLFTPVFTLLILAGLSRPDYTEAAECNNNDGTISNTDTCTCGVGPCDNGWMYYGCYRSYASLLRKGTDLFHKGSSSGTQFNVMKNHAQLNSANFIAMARHSGSLGHSAAFRTAPTQEVPAAEIYRTICETPCADVSSRFCGCSNQGYRGYPGINQAGCSSYGSQTDWGAWSGNSLYAVHQACTPTVECNTVSGKYCTTVFDANNNVGTSSCSSRPTSPCPIMDGTLKNTVGIDCKCGTANCDTASGRYCISSSNICSTQPAATCAVVNGSSSNTVGIDCKCGTANCDAASGRYCVSSSSSCSKRPADTCTVVDGTSSNTVGTDCKCGTTNCNDAVGLFCVASQNSCASMYVDVRVADDDTLEINLVPPIDNAYITHYSIKSDIVGPFSFPQTSSIAVASSKRSQALRVEIPRPPKPILHLSNVMIFGTGGSVSGGIASRIVVPSVPLNGGAFSFSAWIMCTNVDSPFVRIFDLGTGEANDNVFLTFQSDRTMSYQLYHGEVILTEVQTSEIFPFNTWILVQLIHRAVATVSIYWNGVEKATGSLPLPLVTSRVWYLGGATNWAGQSAFEGSMKEVVFFQFEMEVFIKETTSPDMIFRIRSNSVFSLGGLTGSVTGGLTSKTIVPSHPLNGGSFSFSAWVKCLNPEAANNNAMVPIFDFGTAEADDNVVLSFLKDKKRMIYSVRHGSKMIENIATSETFLANTWVLVQVIHRANKLASIYWNGVEKASGSVHLPLVTDRTWYLGQSHWGTDPVFQGSKKYQSSMGK